MKHYALHILGGCTKNERKILKGLIELLKKHGYDKARIDIRCNNEWVDIYTTKKGNFLKSLGFVEIQQPFD